MKKSEPREYCCNATNQDVILDLVYHYITDEHKVLAKFDCQSKRGCSVVDTSTNGLGPFNWDNCPAHAETK